MTRRAALHVACIAALVAATLAVYAQTFTFDFVHWDDPLYVRDNPQVRRGLTGDGVRWAMTTGEAANWHPVTWLSLMTDATLFGIEPGAFHMTNVLLHAAAAALLYLALRRMTDRPIASAVVAALFAVHPLHVESVAWISQRKDVLAAVFAHGALYAYATYAERRTMRRYAAVTLLLVLGLMSKPTLVTLPAALLLLDCWPLRRLRLCPPLPPGEGRGKGATEHQLQPPSQAFSGDVQRSATPPARPMHLVLEKLPWFALAALASIITYRVQDAGGATGMQPMIDLPTRMANAAVAYVQYLAKAAWPTNLTYLYTHPALPGGTPLTLPQIVVAVLVLAAITLSTVAARRGALIVGWLWFLGMLVPMIGLVQVGRQAYADRYTYLPLTGLFIMLVFGGAELLRRVIPPMRLRAVTAVLIVSLALGSFAVAAYGQAQHWRDAESLVARGMQITPGDPVVLQAYGSVQQAKGDRDAAIDALRRAVRIDPDFAEAHNSLGVSLQLSGRLDEAIAHYREAVRVDPSHVRAHYHLGRALLQRPGTAAAHAAEAMEHLRRAAAGRTATDLDARLLADIEHNLGDALWRLGELDQAAAAYRRCLALNPDDPQARTKLDRLTGGN